MDSVQSTTDQSKIELESNLSSYPNPTLYSGPGNAIVGVSIPHHPCERYKGRRKPVGLVLLTVEGFHYDSVAQVSVLVLLV
jgi:hypothetical protein